MSHQNYLFREDFAMNGGLTTTYWVHLNWKRPLQSIIDSYQRVSFKSISKHSMNTASSWPGCIAPSLFCDIKVAQQELWNLLVSHLKDAVYILRQLVYLNLTLKFQKPLNTEHLYITKLSDTSQSEKWDLPAKQYQERHENGARRLECIPFNLLVTTQSRNDKQLLLWCWDSCPHWRIWPPATTLNRHWLRNSHRGWSNTRCYCIKSIYLGLQLPGIRQETFDCAKFWPEWGTLLSSQNWTLCDCKNSWRT